MDILIQSLVSGLALGCVYALVALGFVMIYKATEVISLCCLLQHRQPHFVNFYAHNL